MEKLVLLLEEYIIKIISETERILNLPPEEYEFLTKLIDNRERLLKIIEKLSVDIDWKMISLEKRKEINCSIDYVKKLDEQLICKLQETRENLKKEIEITFRQKENIKGYNMNHSK